MSVFEDINYTTDKASHIGERYIKASHQYFRLKIFQQLTMSLSLMTKVLVVGSFLFAGLVFLSVSGAMIIGQSIGNYWIGFLVIGLIYFVLALIIYKLRAKFNTIIIKKVGQNFFS
ncbi:phage holin family protein [Winogradskyella litoriviva]|uniref:Phage holin family protein n=1 Tax=Winogradskyella litoriviva TaxID=1220182 RepID=A0ABX2E2W2_9FLAO|nr:phage holin family protein [Winogradskyella litoriviva]NRD22767.1 phage holin family protein [Winogradskyella litoriviva]